ncbi:ribosylnicotinamide kinase [Sporobolomyces salmoneus]|uniref:ribosylnicotinamide kinase n=1 Tax=Sporobolomyces salmoneus TaxID=183962 RepID=UPI003174568C
MPDTTTRSDKPRTIFLAGIGGPTCSGKTTLAKHLGRIIPSSTLLFQDDFAPPSEKVPMHPVHGFQDWDDPAGAIEWDRQREAIRSLRRTGEIPGEHASHDHLNEQVPVPIDGELERKWKEKFTELFEEMEKENREKPSVVIAEGFLMLYDEETVKEIDSRFFVREDYATLKKRRHDRHGYHTAVQSDPEGSLWRDPPDYWDLCVWPAYLKAHRPLFKSEQVETGSIDENKIEGVRILEARELTMDRMVELALEDIYSSLKEGKGRERW